MPANTFGELFRVSTFGESHGPAVGAVIDGIPAGIEIDFSAIQKQLDRRRPGQSELSTSRSETDIPNFLSGLFEGKTTGAPIAFTIPNKDSRSEDYDALKEVYRPGHADYTLDKKFGIRDHRGGGRSSARTMAPWVCAGAIAQQILASKGVNIRAYVSAVGPVKSELALESLDLSLIDNNEVRCPDTQAAEAMRHVILQAKSEGDSLGGVISCLVQGVPAGWGEPQFKKLPAELAHAMFSINAVKGFEMGAGFALSGMKGSEANDAFESKEGKIQTRTNRAGGVLGGISSGMPLFFKVGFKPVSTIAIEQDSVNRFGEKIALAAKGRHDPCVVPRAVPIVEAMTALVLIDLMMMQQARL